MNKALKKNKSGFGGYSLRVYYQSCIFQSMLVFICVGAILLLNEFFGGVIVASLGASGFILFATPHSEGSRARHLIGGYIAGALSGILFSVLRGWVSGLGIGGTWLILICLSAAAAAVTTFLMVASKLAHPPSVALALGLSVEPECLKAAAAAIIGIFILLAVRRMLSKHLNNLI